MFFTDSSEKATRIIDFLRKELQLPKHLLGFELHMKAGKDCIVTVRNLAYYPEDDPPKEGIV